VRISCGYGPLPDTGVLLTATCVPCGYTFHAVLPDGPTAARCGVDHRCGTGVVGPVWALIQPPARRPVRVMAEAA
jgi:hypothetical protein